MSDALAAKETAQVSAETQHEIEQFLYREADLLDAFRLEEWFELLTDDVHFEAPIRTNNHPSTDHPEYSENGYFLHNGYTMLQERVERLQKEYAWAEVPRSRVRHVIGNVRVVDVNGDEYEVLNTQHVHRNQGDSLDPDLLSAQRLTTLRKVDGEFRIAHRIIYLDHNIITTKNITLPLL